MSYSWVFTEFSTLSLLLNSIFSNVLIQSQLLALDLGMSVKERHPTIETFRVYHVF